MVKPLKIEVTGIPALNASIQRATLDELRDMRSLFELLSSDFYKDEQRIFGLKSRGQYEDLKDSTKDFKVSTYGFTYPILFATGALAASLLKRNAKGSINTIRPHWMTIGTSIPYAVFHHSTSPRSKIPRRPLWDEDEDGALMKRWLRTTDKWLEKNIGDKLP